VGKKVSDWAERRKCICRTTRAWSRGRRWWRTIQRLVSYIVISLFSIAISLPCLYFKSGCIFANPVFMAGKN
jgi:hypothetical protein